MLLRCHYQLALVRARSLVLYHPYARYVLKDKDLYLQRRDRKNFLIVENWDCDGERKKDSFSQFQEAHHG